MKSTPTLEDVWHILEETPQTIFLTVTRHATAMLNGMALQCLYGHQHPLAIVPADPESNTANYKGSWMIAAEPMMTPIFLGMRITLTKNLNKAIGFVNGMGATVLSMDAQNVYVRTDQGRRFNVHPWTDPETYVLHFPFRVGYASTLHKVQGATLSHVTLWLGIAKMPAASYVALSRVEYDANWRFVGDPGVHHFTPARF